MIEPLSDLGFWVGVAQVALGLFSFTSLLAIIEWCHTTKRLRDCVTRYIESVEFEWTNKPKEFAFTYRIRAFEILLRRVQSMQPRTFGAYRRVEEVRNILEEWHTGMLICNMQVLPLPDLERFPFEPSEESECAVRKHALEKLQSIKWLKLKKVAPCP